jgi:aspartyl protease family protein
MTDDTTQKTGKIMYILAWLCGIGLMTQLFGSWEKDQINPNREASSHIDNTQASITLKQNRIGHYLTNGTLNNLPATFMLDTGATDVVIPADLAAYYGLQPHGFSQSYTANGTVTVGQTNIEELSIGEIKLYNVNASINPGMEKSQPILLGMSALRKLELQQVNQSLTLIQKF